MPLPAIVLPALIEMAGKIFDRVIPDKAAADRAKQEFAAVAQSQEYQIILSQLAINAEEAKSGNWFISGWRPFIGWICGIALAYNYIMLPFLQFGVYLMGSSEVVKQFSRAPKLDLSDLMPILVALLGLAGYRTIEKVRSKQ